MSLGTFCFIALSEAMTQKIPFHGFASAFLVAAKPKGEEKVLNYCTSLLYQYSLHFVPWKRRQKLSEKI